MSFTDAAPDRFDRRDLRWALASVVLVNVVGGVPAVLGGPESAWFEGLVEPAIYPPGWAFGVVWTVLFTLLGVAVFLVARVGLDERRVRVALGLFVLQFAFNVAWTPVFFALQRPLAALGVIVALAVLIVPTMWAFDRVDRRAAALLVPYLVWVLFAALLNYRFWVLNA
ncbi:MULTISPECIES: TspO/MBR family protein [Halomicrobium]|uniref:TspO and MBR like protein n=2 Tax=Halomicrobium mukohataei TaxID=57705 RepID=C7P294_HALMD|nr:MULTISPECIES: TspO/MBR family protein [Halomicrobium]ACV47323.1 TspO and MBR like protein [Halomicrobium mukohataei DSM 12286]QCD65791.1 tryptophan-rich sensory protein [Halomicrobium mukohataei]QFR20596.1 tryptophan-rich sensory protein [Halomicrobium sp. ZPS1]